MQRLNHISCPFCNSVDIHPAFELLDNKITKEKFTISDCNNCKLRFTQNPPAESSIGPYYDSPKYISHSDNTTGLINNLYHWVRRFMLNRKLSLIKSITSEKSILDIGSGTGYFLQTMKAAGFETTGIEVNEKAREFSRQQFGLQVYSPEYLIENKIGKKFDVATLWHVLEHIYDPKKYLHYIKDQLKNNGHLVIAVPNYESTDASHYKEYWAGYDAPRHLWHFSPETISNLLQENGFTLKNSVRLPFDSFYVSMLSENYKNSFLANVKGAGLGLYSWIISLFNIGKTSSLIYIFQKNIE
ncbi:MAG: class I SAM-dependent methyltransferase [Saprospiraceae bacterium]|nr:class I SAM-dependent methyltransferase [Saprospiraceae bacterium]